MVKVQIDTTQFRTKPTIEDVKKISNNIITSIKDISPTEIMLRLGKGQSILNSIMDYRSISGYKETHLVFLDFDNKEEVISYKEIKDHPFIQKNAIGIYKTFSYTPNIERFRVVFCLNKDIHSPEMHQAVYDYLFDLFPQVDKTCKDISRIFYGGIEAEIINDKNRLSIPDSIQPKKEIKAIITNQNGIHSTYITELIRKKNKRKIKEYYEGKNLRLNIQCSKIEEAKRALKLLNLYTVLGLNENQKIFNCVLEKDNKPSSSIFKTETNEYRYKRFSSTKPVRDIIGVFKILLGKEYTYSDTLRYLFDVFGIEIKYQKSTFFIQKETNKFRKMLRNKLFLKEYPNIHKVLNRNRTLYEDILFIIQQQVYQKHTTERILCTYSLETYANKIYLKKQIKTENRKHEKKLKISKALNILSFLGIIHKLDTKDIPKELLDGLRKYQVTNQLKARNNVYEINLSINNLDTIEEKAKVLVENGFTFSGFNQTFLELSLTKEVSNSIYLQTTQKNIATKTTTFRNDIQDMLEKYFMYSPYILEKDVHNYLLEKNYTKTFIKNHYNSVIYSVLNDLNLNRLKATKVLKDTFMLEQFNEHQYPYIYMKK